MAFHAVPTMALRACRHLHAPAFFLPRWLRGAAHNAWRTTPRAGYAASAAYSFVLAAAPFATPFLLCSSMPVCLTLMPAQRSVLFAVLSRAVPAVPPDSTLISARFCAPAAAGLPAAAPALPIFAAQRRAYACLDPS